MRVNGSRRRTRIVSFRVSDREYEILQGRCLDECAHNVSEYARLAACRGLTSQEQSQYQTLRKDLEQLALEVRTLRGDIQGLLKDRR